MSDSLPESQSRGHHPSSPSSLENSEACPLFKNRQTDSQASRDGTLQHLAVETRDFDILHGDEAMIAAVEKCIAYEERIIEHFRSTRGAAPLVLREQYLCVGDDLITDSAGKVWKGVTGGYPDSVFYSFDAGEAHIVDFKFGAVPVTPTKDNLQGIAYALGLFQHLGPRIKRIVVHFLAPRQGWSEAEHEEKYIHVFTRDEIPRLEMRVRAVIAKKNSKQAKACPKEGLCIWCDRLGECEPAFNAVVPLEGKYADLVCPDVVAPHQLSLPSQFAAALKFANQVEMWAKQVKARCRDVALTEGIDVPGFKLVGRADRKVESVKTFQEVALKNGMTPDQFLETLTPSLTAVEDFVKKAAEKGKGAAAIRQLTSDLEEAGATSKGKPYYFLKECKSPADNQNEIINV